MGEGLEIAVDAALSAFSEASQHHRLMRLDFPLKDGPTAILLPNKLLAHEEVSRSFRFDVEVLSDDPRIPLKVLMGRMVTISLVREDGSQRYLTATSPSSASCAATAASPSTGWCWNHG
jgi:type VI secretion system secreted protein VgrG